MSQVWGHQGTGEDGPLGRPGVELGLENAAPGQNQAQSSAAALQRKAPREVRTGAQ